MMLNIIIAVVVMYVQTYFKIWSCPLDLRHFFRRYAGDDGTFVGHPATPHNVVLLG
jgi:hypothetical protein